MRRNTHARSSLQSVHSATLLLRHLTCSSRRSGGMGHVSRCGRRNDGDGSVSLAHCGLYRLRRGRAGSTCYLHALAPEASTAAMADAAVEHNKADDDGRHNDGSGYDPGDGPRRQARTRIGSRTGEHSHGPYVGAAKGHTAPVSRARQLMFFSQ
jgi:hypothetical protein